MNRIVATIVMVAVAASAAVAASYRNIDSPQAKAMIDKGGVFLLDVRSPEEYRQGHLQGAVLIPVDRVAGRLDEIPRNKTILVYCAVGSRSSSAASLLTEKGYREVYNMKEGIVGWYRRGLPIVR